MIRAYVTVLLFFSQIFLFAQTKDQTGYCTFYADKFQGHHTASGELYNKDALTAAHRSLPFNTLVEVTNLRNNKKVVVRINDRGPVSHSRLLDVSKAAAIALDMVSYGVQKVSIKVLDAQAPMPSYDTIVKPIIVNKPIPEKKVVATNTIPLANHQLYTKDLKPADLHGYGVQLGYYKSKSNCVAAIASYETKYKTTGYFFVEQKTQGTYYRLILGNFDNKQQADALKVTIAKDIQGCFVVAFEKL